MSVHRPLSARAVTVRESMIRRIFEEAREIRDPINLTLGQPDFPAPEAIKRAAIAAIENDRNGYTSNRGDDALLARIAAHLRADVGWDAATGPTTAPDSPAVMVVSGTTGALVLAALCLLDADDEIIIPDPHFPLYANLAELCGARALPCDTYPDFRLTAERVEPLITARTRAVLLNTPANPTGVVSTERECRDLLDLCRRHRIFLISDEIYDAFTYPECRTARRAGTGEPCCPSPARFPQAWDTVLLIRGFGKTCGVTGWRLGYAAGPAHLIEAMVRLHQHVYICAPTPLQHGIRAAFDVDMSAVIERFSRRRELVCTTLGPVTELVRPGGAFYAFVPVPPRLGMTATQFKEAARARRVLIVPGVAFSARDSHFRLSYAVDDARLAEGLAILADLMRG